VTTPNEDQRPHAIRPDEKNQILEIVNRSEFKSLPPIQIISTLADQGEYIASESTIYHVLKETICNIIEA